MKIGNLARKTLGKKFFKKLAHYYRAFFFDIEAFVNTLPCLKSAKNILEIGGGDGAIAERILSNYPQAKVVMVDIAESIGSFINESYLSRTKLIPSCTFENYLSSADFTHPDIVLISDVIHHIPASQRRSFLARLIPLLNCGTTLIVKEVQPEGIRARLSLIADKYISGDMNTSLIGKQDLITLIMTLAPSLVCEESDLFKIDKPNYSLSFKVKK